MEIILNSRIILFLKITAYFVGAVMYRLISDISFDDNNKSEKAEWVTKLTYTLQYASTSNSNLISYYSSLYRLFKSLTILLPVLILSVIIWICNNSDYCKYMFFVISPLFILFIGTYIAQKKVSNRLKILVNDIFLIIKKNGKI